MDPADPLDRHFYTRALRRITAAFAPRSNIYEALGELESSNMSSIKKEQEPFMKKRLSPQSIDFYNEVFEEVDNFINPYICGSRISRDLKKRAVLIYKKRLKKEAKLSDLVAMDVFYSQSPNKDVFIEGALQGIKNKPMARDSIRHMFLHRAQQSDYIFLNEIIVGHFLKLLTYGDTQLLKPHLDFGSSYYLLASYSVERLSRQLKISPDRICGLQFADNRTIEAVLPRSFLDLMLLTSSLFNYVYLYSLAYNETLKQSKKKSAMTVNRLEIKMVLSMVISAFLIPTIEGLDHRPFLDLKDLGSKTDELFYPLIADMMDDDWKRLGPSRVELIQKLLRLSEIVGRKYGKIDSQNRTG